MTDPTNPTNPTDATNPADPPIAVVGLGALLPGAVDVPSFWTSVLARTDLITDVPEDRWRLADHHDPDPKAPDRTYARRGAFLPDVDFDPLQWGIPPHALSAIDTTQLLALLVADQTFADHGRDKLTDAVRERTAVLLGCGSLELMNHMAGRMQRPLWEHALRAAGLDEPTVARACEAISAQYVPWQEDTFPGLLSNVVAGRIANRFDLHGTNMTVDAACASSLAALNAAVGELHTGRADLVLTGGVDTMNDPTMFLCFSKTPALSRTSDCRPFAADGDGTVLGEGLAMLLLKRLADAERDGDRIYALVRGVGSASDGRGSAIYAPRAEGQTRALRRAYERAGYGPDTVELVEAHGTGTRAGDAVEYGALREVFEASGRTDRQWCALGSVKSQLGHTKYAAGAVSLVKTVMALHHRVLPPTLKADTANPALDLAASPFHLNTEPRPWVARTGRPRRAAVSGFGFGGSNFHVTLEEYGPEAADRRLPHRLALYSAPTGHDLARVLRAGGAPAFDPAHPARLALVHDGHPEPQLRAAAERIAAAPETPFALPGGCRYAYGPAEPGRIAFLFPGQGAQYPGMGADLACWFPAARHPWDLAAGLPLGDAPLHTVAFPPGPVDEARRARLDATEWAQPALAAHSLSLLAVLDGLGLRADCYAGHSFGELVALHAAGAYGAADLLRLARRRGELMRDAAGSPAGMIAVRAGRDEAAAVLAEAGAGVWLVNDNAPEQVVVAGGTAPLERAADLFARRGRTVTRLRVSTAFHSPLVAPAADGLRAALHATVTAAPARPVYGNTHAAPYPADAAATAELAARHLASPVRFREMVAAMRADGVRTFVEVGAGGRLSGLVRAVCPDVEAVPLDRPAVPGVRALLDGLARLALLGVPFHAGALAGPPPAATRPPQETTVRINGRNHGQPYPTALSPALPVAPVEPVEPVASAAATVPVPVAAVPAADTQGVGPVPGWGAGAPVAEAELLRTVEELQRQTAEAHTAFHQQMAAAHAEFLRTAETSLAALLGMPAVTAPPAAAAPLPLDPPAFTTPASIAPAFTAPAFTAPETPAAAVQEAPAAPVAPVVAELPPAGSGGGTALDVVRDAVAERTGFPAEVIRPGMELETDLGIDSIKRVEILAAIGERLGAMPGDTPGYRLRTIEDVVRAYDPPAGEPAGPTAPVAGPVAPAEPAGRDGLTRSRLLAEPVPAPGLSVDGLRDGPVAVVGDSPATGRALVAALAAAGVRAVHGGRIPADAVGVVLLGLEQPGTPEAAVDLSVSALATARELAGPHARLFVTVQDTGGDFGLTGAAPERALTGQLAALVRTVAHEWPQIAVKAVDVDAAGREPAEVADRIAAELLHGGSHPEVGLRGDGARLVLRVAPAEREPVPPRLGPDSFLVVTGGARGVTAAAVRALAEEYRPRILLLGRTVLADEPAGLPAAADRAALVRALAERGDPDPIGRAARVLAAREVRATLEAVRAAGAQVRYADVDVRDASAVAAEVARARTAWGPVTAVLHGAGVLADAKISDKTEAQIRAVAGPKVLGLAALLAACADDPLDVVLAFSSAAGVFGNAGQSDYAMANTVVDHLLGAEQARRPGALVRSVAWGPWAGGMVTPELAERFGRAGIDTIALSTGARAVVQEVRSAGPVGVVLEAGRGLGATVDRTWAALVQVDSAHQPHLLDHAVGGRPVLPLALAAEWLLRATGADALAGLRVLRALPLPDLEGRGHVVRVVATEDGVELRCGDGIHVRAGAADTAAPGHWTEPGGVATPLRYDGRPLFHGPMFRALDGAATVTADGAAATVRGLRELGWPGRHWRTDPAALDGCLQLALLWAREVLGEDVLPMAVGRLTVHRPGPLDGPGRCVLRPGRVAAPVAGCDVAVLDASGRVVAELLGVELVVRPS
ncbi:type I polyketide synthase [Kitasatospora phosalacinea]|uniref:type I polyketide synthase n=1 Tax=Kitasatospora phosalacinea TaxID=2065 RepID=UPI000692505B|nr:type I polyketide synthase [Kitasatospora phosalacinea]